MEGILDQTAIEAPQPTTPFEAYVIKQLGRLDPMQAQLDQIGPMQVQLAQLGPMQKQLNSMQESIGGLQESIGGLQVSVDGIHQSIGKINHSIDGIHHSIDDLSESIQFVTDRMVTKEDLAETDHRFKAYVDNAVIANRESMIPLVRKEDKKVDAVITTLEDKTIFDSRQAKELKMQGPFARAV